METLERWLKRIGLGGGLVLLAIYLVFLAWTLPSHELVHVTGTETRRGDVETREGEIRAMDVRYVMAEDLEGAPRMYRNEDTGWGWPPYFKFDSGNVAAQAKSFSINPEKPTVKLTSYGFRIPMFSAFPNVLDMERVEPGTRPIPWLTLSIGLLHVILVGAVVAISLGRKRAREEGV